VIARDKKVLFKKIIDDMYKGIEYAFEVEEKLYQGRNNNLTAYIPSLRHICLKMLPSNMTARSLSIHYENVDLHQRKNDASDDSFISSENEGIDTSLPVKYPDLSAKQMVRRIQRWCRRQKGTIYLDIIIRIRSQHLMVPVGLGMLRAECKLLNKKELMTYLKR